MIFLEKKILKYLIIEQKNKYIINRGDIITLLEFKEYIEFRNYNLTVDDYLYITSYIDLINSVRYISGDNTFEIVTTDNNYYKINIKENNKIKKKN